MAVKEESVSGRWFHRWGTSLTHVAHTIYNITGQTGERWQHKSCLGESVVKESHLIGQDKTQLLWPRPQPLMLFVKTIRFPQEDQSEQLTTVSHLREWATSNKHSKMSSCPAKTISFRTRQHVMTNMTVSAWRRSLLTTTWPYEHKVGPGLQSTN